MENAQISNPVFARHNEALERENAELRDNIKMLKQRQKDFGDAFLELFGSRLDAHFESALADWDVVGEVNNRISDLDTSGLDLDLWDHQDEIRDILNDILKNSSIKLELY